MVHPEDVGQLLPRLDMSVRLGVYVRSRGGECGDGLVPHLILILRVRNGKETLPRPPCPVLVLCREKYLCVVAGMLQAN